MGNKTQTALLQQNKYMRTEAEVAAFEAALAALARSPDPGDLPDLFEAFTDATAQNDVMWSLLHFVESFGIEKHFQALIQALPAMLPDASEWAAILHCRMLNSEKCRNYYKGLVGLRDGTAKQAVEMVLGRIRDNDVNFAARVQEVLGG